MTRPDTAQRIAELAAAVQLEGSHVALGAHVLTAQAVAGGAAGITRQDGRVSALQALIYEHAYCRRLGVMAPPPAAPAADGDPFAASLMAANASQDHWDRGWEVIDYGQGGQTMVAHDVRTRMVWPGEYLAEAGAAGGAPQSGARVSLYASRGSDRLQPGFCHAIGEVMGSQTDEDRLLRFYWHVQADGAARLMSALTRLFNRYSVPFRFKLLSAARAYPRSDGAVLYVARRWYAIAAQLAAEIHAQVRDGLHEDVPLFARELAEGLGFGEDPGGTESFGGLRCRLVAQGLVAACDAGRHDAAGRVAAIAAEFERAGMDLATPHLNGRMADPYPYPVPG